MLAARMAFVIVGLGVSLASADVVTSRDGSRLTVTGDGAADSLLVEPSGDGVAVRGLEGTLVDGSADDIVVSGVRRLLVRLHEGADRLTLSGVDLPDGINVRLGRGNDRVVLDAVRAGRTRLAGGSGHDAVRVYGPSTVTRLSVSAGTGYDLTVVDGVWVPGDLRVDAGPDDDEVSVVATEVGDDVRVDLGNGDDVLLIADVVVHDDTDLDGDDGEDDAFFGGYVWFDDDLDIDGFGDDWWW